MYKNEEAVPPIVSEELWDKANEILQQRSLLQSSKNRNSYQNKYPYSGKLICSQHHVPYYRAIYHYRTGDREVWQCQEYARQGRKGCAMPVLYTMELDELLRLSLDQVPVDRGELLRELLQIYDNIQTEDIQSRYIAQYKHSVDEILRRKDRLLDLNINGCISDEEFTQRNERFNQELAGVRIRLHSLEEQRQREHGKTISSETLYPVLKSELVVERLADRIEARPGVTPQTVLVSLFLRVSTAPQNYLIQRRRGKPSVCTAQYT